MCVCFNLTALIKIKHSVVESEQNVMFFDTRYGEKPYSVFNNRRVTKQLYRDQDIDLDSCIINKPEENEEKVPEPT